MRTRCIYAEVVRRKAIIDLRPNLNVATGKINFIRLLAHSTRSPLERTPERCIEHALKDLMTKP